jgi:hypothetical protein
VILRSLRPVVFGYLCGTLALLGLCGIKLYGATFSTYAVGTEPKGVAIAYFNNDGKMDLAVLNGGSASVSILLGDGAGNFTSKGSFSTGDSFGEAFALSVADFNGDGKMDVVVSKPNVHLISIASRHAWFQPMSVNTAAGRVSGDAYTWTMREGSFCRARLNQTGTILTSYARS